jgi:hypothetical protein
MIVILEYTRGMQEYNSLSVPLQPKMSPALK